LLRARSQLGRWFCRRRGVLFRVGPSKLDDGPTGRMADPTRLSGLPTQRPSRCTRVNGSCLRMRNVRSKGPNSSVLTFAVDGLQRLDEFVVPFFERHPPLVKRRDFEAFSDIVRSMRLKEHLTQIGFERLVRIAFGMNADGEQRTRSLEQVLAGSSETAREAHLPARAGG
jgi:hypothetical protein